MSCRVSSRIVDEILPSVWPPPLIDDFDSDQWPLMDSIDISSGILDSRSMRRWVCEKKQIRIRTITWNLCAKPPPPTNQIIQQLIPPNKFHLIFFGTEECERSIAMSALNPSKKAWESYLIEVIGPNYTPLRSQTLQATHLIVFAHKGISHHCSFITSAAVATGAGNTLGNKGAVAIFLKFGTTRLLVANAHLAAHQHAEEQRNSDYSKISRTLPVLLEKKEVQHAVSSRPRVLWGGEGPSQSGAKADDSTSFRTTSNRLSGSANLTLLRGEASSEVSAGNVTPPSGPNDSSSNDLAAMRTSSQPNLVPEENDSLSSDDDVDYSNTNTNTTAAAAAAAVVSRQPPQRLQRNHDNSSDLGSEVSATSSSAMTATMLDESKVGRGGGRAFSLSYVGRQGAGDERSLDQCADAVIFMGDLNYRIKGNRAIVSSLLRSDMHEVLLMNDQLKWNMDRGLVLQNFKEPPLNFRPTYKMDVGTDTYDSGPQRRIPAWTDRILYTDSGRLHCLAYNADFSITSSDHKPVYATFAVMVDFDEAVLLQELTKLNDPPEIPEFKKRESSTYKYASNNRIGIEPGAPDESPGPNFSSESQVCHIM